MSENMRGIYSIPCTPFTENLELDEKSLISIINFIVASGAHGIVAPVNASEFNVLTDDERLRVVEICVKATDKRLPFIAGVAGVHIQSAIMFAKHAEEAGADGLIAMPPYLIKATEAEIFKYFHAISSNVNIPIFIQNFVPPGGTSMSGEFVAKMIREIEHVDYVKEETQYAGHVITELMNLLKGNEKFRGVMGGKAGRYIIDEYNRGCCGNMPACEVSDIQAKIWDKLEKGDQAGAVQIYNQVLPLLNMESQYGATLYKEVLYRRGIIDNPSVRSLGNRHLDSFDHKELDRIMDEIKDLLIEFSR